MADYNESILMNGFGEIGNTSGWLSSGAALSSDPAYGGKHFVVSPSGYMKQDLPLTVIVRTSKSYKFLLQYFRAEDELNPNVTEQAVAELVFTFKDGLEDFYSFPFQGLAGGWRDVELLAEMPEDAELVNISINIKNNEKLPIRLDNMQLLPDVQLVVEQEENDFGNYREKSILYGLEKDMPLLGGY